MRSHLSSVVIAASILSLLAAAPAYAARQRTFVASTGVDGNPCSFTEPCSTFQYALSQTDVNGEITALDSDGFGPLTISQSVTITSAPGVEALVPPVTNGTSVAISGTNTNVTLRGLTINGEGVGYNGIVFTATGSSSLTVTNCVVENFVYYSSSGNPAGTGIGIAIEPSSGTVDYVITNTVVVDNQYAGIFYVPMSGTPGGYGVIDHVVATGNFNGIAVNTANTTGGATVAAISNSVASNNSGDGIYVQNGSGTTTVSIDNADISSNAEAGIQAISGKVLLGRSVITGNLSFGVYNQTSPNTFYTYGNNQINLNGNGSGGTQDINGALNTSFLPR
jgi:hypothetical protein